MKFFSKIGSRVGSNSSSIFSNNIDYPYLIAPSKNLIKTPGPSLIFNTFISLLSFFLIQLTAYNYGSIHNGHLLALLVNIPF